jgi:hypothetical protein
MEPYGAPWLQPLAIGGKSTRRKDGENKRNPLPGCDRSPTPSKNRRGSPPSPVAGEVTVVAVDHGQACSHVAGEIEGGDAGTKREGRERVPQIVDPAQRRDPGGLVRRLPVAVAEVVQVKVAAAHGRKHERAVRIGR